ncbi:hypothetical protein [Oceanibaculum indicum]|uniref:Uncharacterized protein n=1 Tax=Oceanibaculum indicum TaxID=526216 RepID=A0A420WH74_9PROT|nr:hypothetical protein [Oceanibaculum indicum]RKQ70358.1 hypothetical protein BCL74_2303 [Oceanibaculum indicum]
MTGEELRDAIRAMLESHPGISVSSAGHVTHAERYVTLAGAPVGFEPKRVEFQNLWVRSDSIRLTRLRDIDHVCYRAENFSESTPNHNLFGEKAFKNADLVRFKVTDLWQAARVLLEVAGEGAAP